MWVIPRSNLRFLKIVGLVGLFVLVGLAGAGVCSWVFTEVGAADRPEGPLLTEEQVVGLAVTYLMNTVTV